MADTNLFEDFIKTLEGNKDLEYPIMTHLPSIIRIAKNYFDGYLAEEELQERQYNGRYWDICPAPSISSRAILYIILDNDTVLCAEAKVGLTKELYTVSEDIEYREKVKQDLPQSLRGRFYDFRLYN